MSFVLSFIEQHRVIFCCLLLSNIVFFDLSFIEQHCVIFLLSFIEQHCVICFVFY